VAITESDYEKRQRFNPIVAWLHSFRYKHVLDVMEEFSSANGGGEIRLLEIGCAHAKLFGMLDERFNIDYVAIEPNRQAFDTATSRYKEHANFSVSHGFAQDHLDKFAGVDVVIALETFEHIPEHIVVRLTEEIGKGRPKLFICSVPVEVGPAIWFKNVGSLLFGYMRHKEYSWGETFWAGLGKLDKLPPHGTTHKGFDWRWLAQTIRHNMRIREIRTFPLALLPGWLSTSVFFVAEPRGD
jgi:Methyltransferase domain